jgi:hypothetical protein
MNIIKAIQNIKSYLDASLLNDKDTLQYKSAVEPSEFEHSVPDIYCFTMPSSALIENYPSKCPTICITLDGKESDSYLVTCHLCVSSSSVSGKEMAIQDSYNRYHMGTDTTYNTDSDEGLIISSILFTDQIYKLISIYSDLGIAVNTVNYCDVSLPDYPYAISSISFNLMINKEDIGARIYDNMY